MKTQNNGFQIGYHSFVQPSCTENASASSEGIVRLIRLQSKKNIKKINQITEKALSKNYNIYNY